MRESSINVHSEDSSPLIPLPGGERDRVRGKSAREVDLVRRDALLFRNGVGFWNNFGGIWPPGRISNGVKRGWVRI